MRSYDARFPVFCAWALEFAPVNVSCVLVQPRGDDFLCVGSRSWFFESLPDCVAVVESKYPFKIGRHILPPENAPSVWSALFADLCVFNVAHAPDLADGRRMLITQAFLSRLAIDTAPHPWDLENNQLLVDSLNGYRVKEQANAQDVFSTTVQASHEQYLARALEHFAAHENASPARGARKHSAPIDYSMQDRAVICGGRELYASMRGNV